ncbi:MAG: hypothetical protein ONB11_11720 [candidate division KSB1 bacterium]|nr:hypothetical protein [candidate division KSB1 bacterium]MDZ7340969.1 hypothetical protein [candidate division KSB1 bacterium]
MEYTFKDLKEKTVAELKEIAKGIDHEAVKGYTQLNKEHLLVALCKALNIDMHVHHEIKGLDKTKVKQRIRELKQQRNTAIAAHDYEKLRSVRRQMKRLKNRMRQAAA